MNSSASSSIRMVAKAAGVSVATVSRAVNNTGTLRPSTRRRVLAAVATLGYTPSAKARAMRWGPIDSVGWLISPTVHQIEDDGWIADNAIPLFKSAAAYGMTLIPEQMALDGQGGVQRPTILKEGRVGAALIMGELPNRALQQLQEWNVPVCFFDTLTPIEDDRFLNVFTDSRWDAYEAIRHLHSLGHRRIGFVHGTLQANQPLIAGYRQAVEDFGCEKDERLTICVNDNEQNYVGGLHATRRLLSLQRAPTAICLATDWCGVGALTAAAERGVSVPGQLSLVTLSDSYLARQTEPALTAMRHDALAMGHAAMELLVQQIQGVPVKQRKVVCLPMLMVRSSTAGRVMQDARTDSSFTADDRPETHELTIASTERPIPPRP